MFVFWMPFLHSFVVCSSLIFCPLFFFLTSILSLCENSCLPGLQGFLKQTLAMERISLLCRGTCLPVACKYFLAPWCWLMKTVNHAWSGSYSKTSFNWGPVLVCAEVSLHDVPQRSWQIACGSPHSSRSRFAEVKAWAGPPHVQCCTAQTFFFSFSNFKQHLSRSQVAILLFFACVLLCML